MAAVFCQHGLGRHAELRDRTGADTHHLRVWPDRVGAVLCRPEIGPRDAVPDADLRHHHPDFRHIAGRVECLFDRPDCTRRRLFRNDCRLPARTNGSSRRPADGPGRERADRDRDAVVPRLAIQAALVFGMAVVVPHALAAQAIPQIAFSVRNNTSVPLTCDFQNGDDTWRSIELAPGAEWREPGATDAATAHIKCRPPVRQVACSVSTGHRYAFLRRTPQSPVKLRKIAPQ